MWFDGASFTKPPQDFLYLLNAPEYCLRAFRFRLHANARMKFKMGISCLIERTSIRDLISISGFPNIWGVLFRLTVYRYCWGLCTSIFSSQCILTACRSWTATVQFQTLTFLVSIPPWLLGMEKDGCASHDILAQNWEPEKQQTLKDENEMGDQYWNKLTSLIHPVRVPGGEWSKSSVFAHSSSRQLLGISFQWQQVRIPSLPAKITLSHRGKPLIGHSLL